MRPRFRVQAQTIYPVCQPTVENGFVEIENGTIVDIGKQKTPSSNTIDLGLVSIIPGLVNTHTHLEFSQLAKPLGYPGIPFTEWVRRVVEERIDSLKQTNKSVAIKQGMQESLDCGVVALGDIATEPIQLDDYSQTENTIVFLERLGRDPQRIESTASQCNSWLKDFSHQSSLTCGISPHAPYSVHPDLLDRLVQDSNAFRCAVAMHLAETPEEIQLLKDQTGPFVEMLKALDAWHPESYANSSRIIDYLEKLSQSHRALIIHGNYLTESDVDLIARHNDKMSVVYCPRTHEFFGHETYPLPDLLKAGINVAIGTDSRASTPDLNLFKELQLVSRRFPALGTEAVLHLGTEAGVKALGLSNRIGTIQPGNAASINVVSSAGGELFGTGSACVPLQRILANA